MKKIYNIKWVLLFLMTCVATLAHAVEITFNVSVPNGTQKVYIIGSTDALGNWNANGGGAKLMTQVDATNWTIAIDLVANTTYQYMFLCGPNWAYEQSPNTNFPFTTGASDANRNNTITAWNSVPPKVATVTFNVSVPSTTEKVYIAGGDNDDATTLDELGNWNVPTGRCLQMDKTGAGTFSLTMDLSPDKIYYYKYLCGASWDYEQQAANAFEVNTSSPQTTNDVIEAWKGVPAELSTVQNYLKRNGNQITDAAGNNFVMRSIGLGNYMVWEPYMWKVSNYTNAGIMQDIVGRMSQLLTPEDMQSFIDGYMSNYITKDEVDSLKKWGFNAIRLPMHYNLFINTASGDNTFIEKGFAMTEQLRQWCADNEMYLVLDLHAAPGGQGADHAISDSRSPGLWDGDANGTAVAYQDKVVILWKELARRFGDKEWIGGYDLLNETNYGGNNLKLLELYKRCVNQIRLYDQHSIIYLEGNWFANDFSTIAPSLWGADWDTNMAYSCHKYWAVHDGFAGESLRTSDNVPLWLGETGENSNEWFYQNVKLAESRNIGWAWWAFKKIDNISGFTSIKASESLNKIMQYVNDGTGMNPTNKAENYLVFQDFLEYVKLKECKINYDVLFSLIDQQADGTQTRPYGVNAVPGVVHATNYDMGRQGYAYYENNSDQVLERTSSSAGAYNSGWVGRNDAVDFNPTTGVADAKSNGYNLGWTNPGEWVQYSMKAAQHGIYKINMRHASAQASTIAITNGTTELITKPIASTGDWQTWSKTEIGTVELQEGWNKLRLAFKTGSVNVNYLEFELVSPLNIPNDTATINPIAYCNETTLIINPEYSVEKAMVYGINGIQIAQLSNEKSFGIDHLPNGTYVLEVMLTNGERKQMKFVR